MEMDPNGAPQSPHDEEQRYHAVIEPPFWGTGDILTWQADRILETLDRDGALRSRWSGTTGPAGDPDGMYAYLAREVMREGLIEARGYYGFFPVFTDANTVFLLDPSDFSTTLLALTCVPDSHQATVCDALLATNDLIGLQVVTIGPALQRRCSAAATPAVTDTGYSACLDALGQAAIGYLSDRMAIEMRRALAIDPAMGRLVPWGIAGMPAATQCGAALELMCAADRLAIEAGDDGTLHPSHSSLGIFLPRLSAHRR